MKTKAIPDFFQCSIENHSINIIILAMTREFFSHTIVSFVDDFCIFKINLMVVHPCMICDVRSHQKCKIKKIL